ncbi:glycosyltransferase [Gangjinia marincola]|uniref:Glycosyltransferase n=1 Tax=Gangjinia marincola TaxID=578463 RepID=A0ABN1MHJ1_9FLAO
MIWVVLLVCITYAVLILGLAFGIHRIPNQHLIRLTPKTHFSIIVPFRNEAQRMEDLLNSLLSLNYPNTLFEVIFVDDASTDHSQDLINQHLDQKINFNIVENQRSSISPKKDAITTAVQTAKGNFIITTDADVSLPANWLSHFDALLQKEQPVMIVAPVTLSYDPSQWVSIYDALDFLSLQGVTMGSFGFGKPLMCNGANLGYDKKAFLEIHGFEGNANIASGDDVFLLQKFLSHGKKISYLNAIEATVSTPTVSSFSAFTQQRKRWAAKTSSYTLWFPKFTGLIVLLMNVSLIGLFVTAFFWSRLWIFLGYFFLIKSLADQLLLFRAAQQLGQQDLFKHQWKIILFHPFITIYVALSSFLGYSWKGRTFKH